MQSLSEFEILRDAECKISNFEMTRGLLRLAYSTVLLVQDSWCHGSTLLAEIHPEGERGSCFPSPLIASFWASSS